MLSACQYFRTLQQNYKKQMDDQAASLSKNKAQQNKMCACWNAKLKHCKEALPVFKTWHGIEDADSSLDHLLDMGYISPEDNDPGAVDGTVWQAKAEKRGGQGQKVWEIVILQWRAPEVSNHQQK